VIAYLPPNDEDHQEPWWRLEYDDDDAEDFFEDDVMTCVENYNDREQWNLNTVGSTASTSEVINGELI
jgi:hypothetical protein